MVTYYDKIEWRKVQNNFPLKIQNDGNLFEYYVFFFFLSQSFFKVLQIIEW